MNIVDQLMLAPTRTPARAAGYVYNRAIAQHFELAHRLLREGKPDEAEKVAKGAALLRWFAASEVMV